MEIFQNIKQLNLIESGEGGVGSQGPVHRVLPLPRALHHPPPSSLETAPEEPLETQGSV